MKTIFYFLFNSSAAEESLGLPDRGPSVTSLARQFIPCIAKYLTHAKFLIFVNFQKAKYLAMRGGGG